MKINGRLILILCAVALFVRIWGMNGRKPHHVGPPGHASIQARPLTTTERAPQPALRRTADLRKPTAGETTPANHNVELWTTKTVPFKLPEGLSAGKYRVVSDSGRVAQLSIEDAARAGTSADFVAISTETERWYLIRLKSEGSTRRTGGSTAGIEFMPSVPDLPLSFMASPANRKFDFTGFATAATVESPAASTRAAEGTMPANCATPLLQQAERPAPPELPSPL